jgi:hypothetical protein
MIAISADTRHGRRILLLPLLLILASCHRSDYTLDSLARSYVQLALALGERDPDSLDFALVPASMRAAVHQSYPSLDQIALDASTLSGRLRLLKFPPEQRGRVEFLRLQLASMEARASMLGGRRLDFDSEARVLFATASLPDSRATERRVLRARIAGLLPAPGTGPDGSTAERYAAYESRFVVQPERLASVMNAALDLCRRRTAEYIALPAGESVELSFVRYKPWSAFSRYLGHAHSSIQVNLDLPITVDDALELACHEGYPGHHVFNTLRDTALAQQSGLPEAQVQLTFSPQSYLAEAAAAYAPRMAFFADERAQMERDVLFPLAGLSPQEAERYVLISSLVRDLDSAEPSIAREYIDGRMELVRAEQQLASEVLMAHSESLLLYLNEYRSYMLAYTDGPRRIAAYLDATTAPDSVAAEYRARWKGYEGLMRELRFRLP